MTEILHCADKYHDHDGREYNIENDELVFYYWDTETKRCRDLKTEDVVRAVNSYEAMLETLKYCQTWFERYAPVSDLINGKSGELPMLTSVKQAIAKAKEASHD